MAPKRIVDYVVVHELCHFKQHDHLEKFWKLVGPVITNHTECREWQKKQSKAALRAIKAKQKEHEKNAKEVLGDIKARRMGQ